VNEFLSRGKTGREDPPVSKWGLTPAELAWFGYYRTVVPVVLSTCTEVLTGKTETQSGVNKLWVSKEKRLAPSAEKVTMLLARMCTITLRTYGVRSTAVWLQAFSTLVRNLFLQRTEWRRPHVGTLHSI
jgi:hypothetical protein